MIEEKDLQKLINKSKKKESKFSKRIVALVISLNAAFTAAVLYVFLRVGAEPTTLIISWFGFTTGELWLLASITKKKVKTEGIIKIETTEDLRGD